MRTSCPRWSWSATSTRSSCGSHRSAGTCPPRAGPRSVRAPGATEHPPRHLQDLLARGANDVFQLQQGSLYPALHKLEKDKLLASEWKPTDTGREAKFYSLTAKGRAQLRVETKSWNVYAKAVFEALDAPGHPA